MLNVLPNITLKVSNNETEINEWVIRNDDNDNNDHTVCIMKNNYAGTEITQQLTMVDCNENVSRVV